MPCGDQNGNLMSRFEFEILVSADHPSIPGHFPGKPIVPGVLMIDQVLAGVLQLGGLELVRLQHVKFSSVLLPDEPAHVLCEVAGEQATFQITSKKQNTNKIFASGKMLMQIQSNETLDT